MIGENKVRELLQQHESEILDFKRELHSLSDDRKKSEFIKDVLAMANTPRKVSAYIIVGVDSHNDGSKTYVGVIQHPDDNDLQQAMERAKVDPRPKFVYQPIMVDGISYGVIEIFPEKNGPFVATKDFGKVIAHQIYFRAGTQNKDATTQEEKRIWKWFLEEPTPKILIQEQPESTFFPSWPEFLQACYGFQNNRLYLFIIGPNQDEQISEDAWKFLGKLPLSLVLDFDPSTRDEGAYHYAAPVLENYRAVHLKTYNDSHTFVPDKACCWYATRGLAGHEISIIEGDWNQWNRKYSKYVRGLIEGFQQASGGRFLTVVCLWDAIEYINLICTIIDENFGDNANYVFASSKAEKLQAIAQRFKSDVFHMPLNNILCGIPHYIVSPDSTSSQIMTLPKIHDQEYILSHPLLHQLSEDLEVLHSCVELEEPVEPRTFGQDFLRGMIVSWRDLSERYDAERDQKNRVFKMIEDELNLRTTAHLNLYHWPGSGGTTVARRVAWDMHRDFPTVLLKRVIPKVTIGRFRLIFEATELPIFTVYEATDIEQDLVEILFAEARESNIPVVFLSVVRHFSIPVSSSGSSKDFSIERSKFISQHLSGTEAFQFANAYKRVVPAKSTLLDDISKTTRTPFWFALTAFEDQFVGITPYVERRLELATELQRDLLTFLALAYYYGHKPMRLEIFAEYLDIHHSLRLDRIFRQPALHELLVADNDNVCRPVHYLVAEQILQIVLSGSGNRTKWSIGLSSWAKRFIDACSEGTLSASDELIELLRSIFIRRNEHESPETETLESTRFSPMIEDIGFVSTEGQMKVFQELANHFPAEPHFRGHLARFHSIQGQHQLAFEEMDKALEIAPKDPLLLHMKGMCYRRQASGIMKELLRNLRYAKPTPESDKQNAKSEAYLRLIVEDAKKAFNEALNIALDSGSDFAGRTPLTGGEKSGRMEKTSIDL